MTIVRTALAVAAVACVLPACTDSASDGGGPIDNRALAPQAPPFEEGIQFAMPETIIPAGEERMMCWIPEWIPDQDYFVTRLESYQGELGGHHIVALRSAIPREAGSVFDCTQIESMVSMRPLILPDLEAGMLPDGFGIRLPQNSRIVIQSHYINPTDQDMIVADVARLVFLPEEQRSTFTEASYFIINAGNIALEAGEGSVTRGCEVDSSINILTVIGHMHELGTWIDVKHDRNGATSSIYSVPRWNVGFRDMPPTEKFDPAAPFRVQAGDRFDVHCGYDNDRGHTVTFPEEMCTMVSYYFPARSDGLILCGD
jgi:hypothetical protein